VSDLDDFIKMRPEERPTLPPGVRPEEIADALKRAKLDDEQRLAARTADSEPREDGPTMSIPDTDATPTLPEAADPTGVASADGEASAVVFATAMALTAGGANALAILGLALLNGLAG
jgi:hypothetical protein